MKKIVRLLALLLTFLFCAQTSQIPVTKAQLVRLYLEPMGQHLQFVLLGNGLSVQPLPGRLPLNRSTRPFAVEPTFQHCSAGRYAPRFQRRAQPRTELLLLIHAV